VNTSAGKPPSTASSAAALALAAEVANPQTFRSAFHTPQSEANQPSPFRSKGASRASASSANTWMHSVAIRRVPDDHHTVTSPAGPKGMEEVGPTTRVTVVAVEFDRGQGPQRVGRQAGGPTWPSLDSRESPVPSEFMM
jgi:hypothetical protein